MSDRAQNEWPLVVYTIALQLSCGLTLAATLCDLVGSPAEVALLRPLAVAIFPSMAAGLLVALLHLGRPREAWRSLANLRHSRLSLEALLTALFALATLAYSSYWFVGYAQARVALGLLTTLVGLSAVVVSALVYMVPSQPVWNAGWLPASFFGTTLLLGGFASAVFVSWPAASTVMRASVAATLAGSVLLLLCAYDMLSRLARCSAAGESAAPEAARVLSSGRRWLALSVLLAGVLPMALALLWWTGANSVLDRSASPFLFSAFVAALLGTALSRSVMYALAALSRF